MANDLGAPVLPGSKSHGQRALLLAATTPGRWTLRNVPASDDLLVLRRALHACGAAIRGAGELWEVDGAAVAPGRTFRVDAGENGTAARLLLMVLPLLGCALELDGEPGLRRRPMRAAVDALRAAGVVCAADTLPIRADGRGVPPGPGLALAVDAAITTQAASGALLAMCLRGGGTVHADAAAAGGYLELTAQVLGQFGARVATSTAGRRQTFAVGPATAGGGVVTLPPDPSARAFPLALAALHGLPVPAGLAAAASDAHPDWHVDDDFARLRAASGDLCLGDLARRPDCVPALAVVAATRPFATTMPGLSALRQKESDRLAALASALRAVAADATVVGDTLTVRGPLRADAALRVPATDDHRIVMALALLGTVLPRGVELDHADAVRKSWPGYFDWLARCAHVAFPSGSR